MVEVIRKNVLVLDFARNTINYEHCNTYKITIKLKLNVELNRSTQILFFKKLFLDLSNRLTSIIETKNRNHTARKEIKCFPKMTLSYKTGLFR